MPAHVSSTGGDDLASTDEVKVYHDEGEQEELERTSEDISEVKLGLVTESEQGQAIDRHSFNGKNEEKNGSTSRVPAEHELNPFYFYPYTHNGASVGKIPGLGSHFDSLQPPPAHTGIQGLPLLSLDKSDSRPGSISPAFAWLHRPSLFPLPGASGQYPSFYSDLAASVQSWPTGGYPVTSGIGGLRSPYTGLLAAARGYPGLMQSPLSPGMSQSSLISQQNNKDIHSHMLQENRFLSNPYGPPSNGAHEALEAKERRKIHIKKPLNAFMLFMKDMRAKVVAECTLKESAAINQILGRKWHALDRAEQAKYYEMAKKERELHLKLYPGWSARDNYAMHSKRKKRRRDTTSESKECSNPKKCRARFGLDQQTQWCKPCRRKKKCIRFMTGDPDADEQTDKEDDDVESNNNSSLGISGQRNGDIAVDSDSDDESYTGNSSEGGASTPASSHHITDSMIKRPSDHLNSNTQTIPHQHQQNTNTAIPAS